MRILILTSSLKGFGAYCLPRLASAPDVDISMVIYNEGQRSNQKRFLKRKLRKVLKIGPLGALNGLRMRSWFKEGVQKHLDIEEVRETAEAHGVRLETTPTINCQRTIDLFQEADAELGLSLGNSYISTSVFQIPRYGMVNVHHEQLPAFQGAQSIIWQVYHNSTHTGYTIHEIDRNIDTGEILFSEQVPIAFKESLKETVSYNYARLYEASAKGLVNMLRDFSTYRENAQPQQGGRSYTTPSFWQYLRMVYNHRHLARKHGGAE